MRPKILIVPDAFAGPDSGAVAARLAARMWRAMGCEVLVYAATPDGQGGVIDETRVVEAPPVRLAQQIMGGGSEEFSAFLAKERPTHVFMLGSAVSKLRAWITVARARGISVICLWWVQDFFCTRGYACLPDVGPCTKCLDGNSLPALWHRCHYSGGGFRQILGGMAARAMQRRRLQECDVVMGSTRAQLALLERFGIPRTRLIQCPLFFDRARLDGLKIGRGDYFVCYGQARKEKGWHLLSSVLDAAPDIRLVLPFASVTEAETALNKFALGPYVSRGQVEVRTDVRWASGVGQIVAESRGVLIPSIWPTTTEYVLLEALGLGKPVVAFSVGVHSEEIVDGENGLLAPLGDVAEFARRVQRLNASVDLQEKLPLGARRLFKRLTDPNRFMTAFSQALKITNFSPARGH